MLPKLLRCTRQANRLPEILAGARETDRWLILTLAYLDLHRLKWPYTVPLRDGEVAPLIGNDLSEFWFIFFRHDYPVQRSDLTIVDAGANVGLFTLFALTRSPSATVLAIEPFPATYQRLLEVIRVNRMDDSVIPLNCALSERNGTVRMDASSETPSQARGVVGDCHDGPTVVVRTKTLEQVLQDHALAAIDLMKMDIEGSELEVILSAPTIVLRRIRRIVMEYHGGPERSVDVTGERIYERLRDAGFERTRLRRNMKSTRIAEFLLYH